jgi:hypothetical protein
MRVCEWIGEEAKVELGQMYAQGDVVGRGYGL